MLNESYFNLDFNDTLINVECRNKSRLNFYDTINCTIKAVVGYNHSIEFYFNDIKFTPIMQEFFGKIFISIFSYVLYKIFNICL